LANHPQVTEAVVVVLEPEDGAGEAALCAYYTGPEAPAPTELAAFLGESLPHYMIPAHFVRLEQMPVTPNGKIDRKSLPKPDEAAVPQQRAFAKPETGLERKLTEIWEAVLGRQVGIDDHFFHIGGDSIKAIQVSARLHKEGLQLEMKQLFLHPTIRSLSPHIRVLKRTASQEPVTGEVRLAPIQRWFLTQRFTDAHHFNQSVMLYREQPLDVGSLHRALRKLTQHHDALRSCFRVEAGRYVQKVRDDSEPSYALLTFDIPDMSEAASTIYEATAQLQQSIDLDNGPLVKLALFRTSEGDHLFMTVHHLVIDGISWRIVLEDFATLYEQAENGNTLELPLKTHSYQAWTDFLTAFSDGPQLEEQAAFWLSQEELQPAPLPKKKKRSFAGADRGLSGQIVMTLTEEATTALTTTVHKAYRTEMNDVLLTALGSAVRDWTGGELAGFWLEGHGREQLSKELDVSRTVGWFTALYPVVLDMKRSDAEGTRLKKVKEALRTIPNKGIGYGLLRYMKYDGMPPEMTFKLKPEISFNYLGNLDGAAENGTFRLSAYEPAPEISERLERRHPVDINGWIRDGKLTLIVDYDPELFEAEQIRSFTESLKQHLLLLIEHCTGKLFSELTPSDISSRRIGLEQLELVYARMADGRQIEDVYTLSPMQEGLMFQMLLEPESQAYFQQLTLHLEGDVEAGIIRQSFERLIARYDMLRTVFLFDSMPVPVQVVLQNSTIEPIAHVDAAELAPEEAEAALQLFVDSQRTKPFVWSESTPMRIALVRTAEQSYKLVWSFHHILLDGWCLGIVLKEWFETYAEVKRGQLAELEPAPAYARYIEWVERQDKLAASAYWRQYLEGFETQTGLPKAAGRRSNAEAPGSSPQTRQDIVFVIDEQRTSKLHALARERNVTLNTVFQVLWGLLLQHYNDTDDVLFGAVVSGRSPQVEDIERMVGLFINTIPVRIRSSRNMTFAGLLRAVSEQALASREYDYYPLYEIQAESALQQHLLDHVLAFENYPLEKEAEAIGEAGELGFRISHVDVFEETHYPLSVTVAPRQDLTVRLNMLCGVFDERTLANLPVHLERLIDQAAVNPDVLVSRLEIAGGPELHELLSFGGHDRGTAHSAQASTITAMFELCMRRNGGQTAILHGDRTVTYAELNRHAEQWAAVLKQAGAGRGSLVAIVADASVELIAAMLGILKAGAAYVPIDPVNPHDRIGYMLEDSGAGLLVTERAWLEALSGFAKVICLDEREERSAASLQADNLQPLYRAPEPDDTAYVIYTSGTTGKPKGVMIPHRGIVNLLDTFVMEYGFGSGDRVLQFASLSFDASVWEIWMTLLSGAALVLAPKEVLHHPVKLERLIAEQRVSVALLPPTYAVQWPTGSMAALRVLVTGGSEAPTEYVNEWSRYTTYANAYGPTEASIITTMWRPVPGGAPVQGTVPIGQPVNGMKAFIMDRHLRLAPLGAAGELCIAGEGLALGYLHRPELTEEKFVPNPIEPGKRMYRTGDLARWLPNGQLEYLGRIDHQVKIRGFRIELGEIETVLLQHPAVQEAIVIDRQDGAGLKYLCAYWVPADPADPADSAGETQLETQVLKTHLSRHLPDYMIPASFVALNQLPLTPNGKIDRKALPEPDRQAGSDGRSGGAPFAAPRSEAERLLARLWSELLDTEEGAIGIDDRFFELGGHSLKAAQLVARVHMELGVELPLKAVFERPTIRELGVLLTSSAAGSYLTIPAAPLRSVYPLSAAQRRLFILNRIDRGQTSYNLPTAIRLEGDVDRSRLEAAFRALIARHDALRTSFEVLDGEPVQRIHDEVDWQPEHAEVPSAHLDDAIGAFIRPFDVSRAPLMRAGIVETTDRADDRSVLLLFDIHHLVADGISVQRLIQELGQLYRGEELPAPMLQYKDYSEWQHTEPVQSRIRGQREYWLHRFSGELPVLELPTDRPRPAVQQSAGRLYTIVADPGLTRRIDDLAKKTETTVYMVLLAGFSILLSKYAGQTDVIIGSPVAGRAAKQLDDVIGMFVATLALRTAPEGGKPIAEFLKEIRALTLEAFEHQDYPFEQLIDDLNLERDLSRNPLFDVMFAYQNMGSAELELDGIRCTPYPIGDPAAQFDLTLEASDSEAGLLLQWGYRTSLFDSSTIERMAGHFIRVLEQMTDNTQTAIGSICLLTGAEREQLAGFYDERPGDTAAERSIHGLFEARAALHPERTALVFGQERVTYGELNERANRIARLLLEQGLAKEDRVGIMLHRTPLLAACILAVWKAGGAYIPIDPDYPASRTAGMLGDAGAAVLLTESVFMSEELSVQLHCTALELDRLGNMLAEADGSNVGLPHDPDRLAYVIYTSGSTGRPKGAMVEHRGMMNHLTAKVEDLQVNEHSIIAQNASHCFDISVWQLFTSLTLGGQTVIYPNELILRPDDLLRSVIADGITVLEVVPSYFAVLLDYLESSPVPLPSLTVLVATGEA
ncbi:amino acid adenylation domain-containing protein, partial [Paenibacillus chartarius]